MWVVPIRSHSAIPEMDINSFLTCVQHYDIISHEICPFLSLDSLQGPFPNPITSMYILKHTIHADGSQMGDIVPLQQLQNYVKLMPCFGKKADS